MTRIRVTGLKKDYGKITIGPLDFEVQDGNIVAIIGPNGAGKTTLVMMIAGIRKPTAGEIVVNDKNEYVVAYLPEVEGVSATMTIRDYALIISEIYKVSADALMDSMTREVGLPPKKKFGEMSKGQQRKALLAAITSLPAEVVILDEPFSGLDVISRYEWKQKLKKLAGSDRLFIITSHEMYDVEEIADFIVFVNRGRVIFAGTVEEAKKKTGCDTLECAFMTLKDIA